MRTLLVLSLALLLVVACLQADAKKVNIPEDPTAGGEMKGTTTITGRRLLNTDGDNEKNQAHGQSGSTTNSPTDGEAYGHRNVDDSHQP